MCEKCYDKNPIPLVWSDRFENCIQCNSTEFPPVAKGLCRRCYATQESKILCACGCGQYVSMIGNKAREYIHGHKIRVQWKNPTYRKERISRFEGEGNPMWGKFGKEHPAYKHEKTKKFRKDSSIRMLDRMEKGERKTTNIEIILSNLLDKMRIIHISQHMMYNKFVVDKYLSLAKYFFFPLI